jgi:dTDP-4-dehydrorhamnose reductase
MKKVLVTGASGLLGSKIIKLFKSDYEMVGTFNLHPFELAGVETVFMDITNPSQTIEIILRHSPDLVIHAAAYRDLDHCEQHPGAAWKVNVDGTRNVVNGCNEAGSKLVFISTDMVFNEKPEGMYQESSELNPMNYYGKSKVEAEKITMTNDQNVVARISLLYGWHILNFRSDFVGWVIDNVKNEQTVKLFTDQYRNVTFTDHVAEAIIDIFNKSKSGIYHIAGNECINRFEFGQKICKVFELNEQYIKPVESEDSGWVAKRPKRCCMDVSKTEHELDVELMDIESNLKTMKNQRSGIGT